MLKDLTDRKFGRWKVIARAGKDKHRNSLWHCIRSCGNEKSVVATTLIRGKSLSCGCMQIESSRKLIESGSKFGRLTVLSFSGIKKQRSMYRCLCECGQMKVIQGHRLKQGITKSCGCYYREIFQNGENSSERSRARAARHRTKKLGIALGGSYSAEDIQFLRSVQDNKCFYCKNRLSDYHVGHMKPLSRGGTNSRSNICLACPDCNRKKYTKTVSEFLEITRKSG